MNPDIKFEKGDIVLVQCEVFDIITRSSKGTKTVKYVVAPAGEERARWAVGRDSIEGLAYTD